MQKNIVCCTDGTWSFPEGNGIPEGATNVYKLYKLGALNSSQITVYDDGLRLGGERLEQLEGRGFGAALFEKVRQAYSVVAHLYEPGDRIFLFGFSRGAYVARCLAAMIAVSGLPVSEPGRECLDLAFRAYRERDDRADLLLRLGRTQEMYPAAVTTLGVWDTVGTLGIPDMFGVNDVLYGFHDTELHPRVLAAYHAVALDERRIEFAPTLWTNPPAPGQIIEQVWFAGTHEDVGGGHHQAGLSNITLSWMLWKARQHGFETVEAAELMYPCPSSARLALSKLHESWDKRWKTPRWRAVPENALVANSVDVRLAGYPGYHPPNLLLNPRGNLNGYRSSSVVVADRGLLLSRNGLHPHSWD